MENPNIISVSVCIADDRATKVRVKVDRTNTIATLWKEIILRYAMVTNGSMLSFPYPNLLLDGLGHALADDYPVLIFTVIFSPLHAYFFFIGLFGC